MELTSSQSFSIGGGKLQVKPLPPPKPQRLKAYSSLGATTGSCDDGGGEHLKGRSLSPLPSSNMMAVKRMGSIHSVSLDLSQASGSTERIRKYNVAHQLPALVLNNLAAISDATKSSSSEPASPSLQRVDSRQSKHFELIRTWGFSTSNYLFLFAHNF